MTFEIALVLGILVAAVILFVTEWVRVDVVALMVMVSLPLAGLLEPSQALAGFSNPAVVTVWAVFILSGGLSRTGVANQVGKKMRRVAGSTEIGLVTAIMLTAAFLSAFMNNVGVAALLLPVVMDTAKMTGIAPSRLLIPLSYSSLLGGLTTMIGTPPNILISEALRDAPELEPFGLFDYTPVGLAVVLAGIAYMALFGRRMLPRRNLALEAGGDSKDLRELYRLREKIFVVRLPSSSSLDGRTLAESRLGTALGLNVIAIQRDGRTRLAPSPDAELHSGDALVVEGEGKRLEQLRGRRYLNFESDRLAVEQVLSQDIETVEIRLRPRCHMVGKTLAQLDFRSRYGAVVLALLRDGVSRRTGLETFELMPDDVLLTQGTAEQIASLRADGDLELSPAELAEGFGLEERLMTVQVPEGSSLAGKTLRETRLGDAYGIGVMGIVRNGQRNLMPTADERLLAGDSLLVKGRQEDVQAVEGLHQLEIESDDAPELGSLESEEVGLAEAVLSPRSSVAGRSLRQLHFREKYGLSVVAIAREGAIHRTGLANLSLRLGDSLLLHGPRQKLRLLGSEPDFIVLTQEAQEAPRTDKAPWAAVIMAAVLLPVLLGWLPIYISAVCGAILMVLTGCLTIDEAYQNIEWKAVFLIAGMLPLGAALQVSGAAELLTRGAVSAVGGFGPLAVVAALYLVTAFGAQVMPTAAVAILLAPIALSTAASLQISPYALMMTVALSASASFMSPVAHPANVLVMGPGGYRFVDYIKVGLPLTLVCLLVVLLVLPIFWPLTP